MRHVLLSCVAVVTTTATFLLLIAVAPQLQATVPLAADDASATPSSDGASVFGWAIWLAGAVVALALLLMSLIVVARERARGDRARAVLDPAAAPRTRRVVRPAPASRAASAPTSFTAARAR